MACPILSINDVSKTFFSNGDALHVIDQVSLHVNQGEFVCLLGPSGSGKSTLFKLAAGLIEKDQGTVYINGQEHVGKPAKVGYMPQKDLLLPWRTLLQNAALPLITSGWEKEKAYNRVMELITIFGLEGFENSYPNQLSGGMRQRVALLRTVLIESDIMLLDEPFAALDALTRERLQEWFLDIWERFRRSVLFITHSIDEAIYLSDRVYVISNRPGKIILEQDIKLPRPRSREIVTSLKFIKYKQTLLKALK